MSVINTGPGAGLFVRSQARWPQSPQDPPPPSPAGFVFSTFSPLVAAVAERCLGLEYGTAPADPARGARTATVLVSRGGDVTSAVLVARAVDAGTRVAPLLFYQAVPNAILGYVTSRWGLTGPVVVLSPVGDPMDEGLSVAAALIEDGDADEALVITVEQDPAAEPADVHSRAASRSGGRSAHDSGLDEARAVLVGPTPTVGG